MAYNRIYNRCYWRGLSDVAERVTVQFKRTDSPFKCGIIWTSDMELRKFKKRNKYAAERELNYWLIKQCNPVCVIHSLTMFGWKDWSIANCLVYMCRYVVNILWCWTFTFLIPIIDPGVSATIKIREDITLINTICPNKELKYYSNSLVQTIAV